MREGHLTSEDMVLSFLDQIARHNNDGLKLRAIISVCPRDVATAQARMLDEERRRGELRSELHGIPIIVKVRRYDKVRQRGVNELTITRRMLSSRIRPWAW